MSDRNSVRLGDQARTFAGATPDRSRPEYFGGGIPWVKSAEVRRGLIGPTGETLTEAGRAACGARWIPAGTIVMAMCGSTAAEVGRLAIRSTANQAVLAVVPGGLLDRDYLFHALAAARGRILPGARGGGQPNLTKGMIDDLRLAVPGLPEQRKAAQVLTTLDAVIANTELVLAKYRAIGRGLSRDLLSGGPPQPGRAAGSGRNPPGRGEEPLGRHCALQAGHAFPAGDRAGAGVRLVRIGHLSGGEFNPDRDPVFLPARHAGARPEFLVRGGDILIPLTGAADRADFGLAVGVPRRPPPCLLNLRVARVRPAATVDRSYLRHVLRSEAFLARLRSLAGGTRQANLSIAQVLSVPIPVPDPAEQRRVAGRLDAAERQIKCEAAALGKLLAVRAGLRRDLTGEGIPAETGEAGDGD